MTERKYNPRETDPRRIRSANNPRDKAFFNSPRARLHVDEAGRPPGAGRSSGVARPPK
jgi:hypothetical protein